MVGSSWVKLCYLIEPQRVEHVTREEILYYFDYDRERGVLIWKNHWNATVRFRCLGKIAGKKDKTDYISVKVNWKLYRIHRLIWFIEKGYYPEQVDHIDGDFSNNKIENLRAVTNRENCQNYKIHRTGKLIGCTWDKSRGNWKAQIKLEGKTKFIGRFNSEQEAHDAYKIKHFEMFRKLPL